VTHKREPWQHLQNTRLGEPVYDALGREVKVGDLIAIGVRSGNQGDLVLGRVTGFGDRKDYVRTFVRKHEPEHLDSITRVVGVPGQYTRYAPPTFDRAVVVKVTYEEPLGGYISGNGKGYTTAYNRRFVVVDE
jgi:hypothetical protein